MTFSTNIIAWFNKQGRKNLPWQKDRTAYRVWISEIMLQQTQVSTVIPYYERFMGRFPTVESLAAASIDTVLKYWTGLGYYARARNLHRSAVQIQAEFQGEFPKEFDKILSLPGIGRSTAGAILTLSAGQQFPILDGNVKRILCRYFAIPGAPNLPAVEKQLWTLAESLLPKTKLRDYTQGLMDLGATLCTRTKPKCETCPLSLNCTAKKLNQILDFPERKIVPKKPKKSAQLIILYHAQKNAVLLEKRPNTGIWAGLFGFPEYDGKPSLSVFCQQKLHQKVKSHAPFSKFRHTFTHFHLDIQTYLCESTTAKLPKALASQFFWYALDAPLEVGVSAVVQRILKELQCHVLSTV